MFFLCFLCGDARSVSTHKPSLRRHRQARKRGKETRPAFRRRNARKITENNDEFRQRENKMYRDADRENSESLYAENEIRHRKEKTEEKRITEKRGVIRDRLLRNNYFREKRYEKKHKHKIRSRFADYP